MSKFVYELDSFPTDIEDEDLLLVSRENDTKTYTVTAEKLKAYVRNIPQPPE